MESLFPSALGSLSRLPRSRLLEGQTPLQPMPNLGRDIGRKDLFVKRDDCTPLAFGGNKVRQLEFYLGQAVAEKADTVLITGAVQSNFVRLAAAAARKLGMDCHIQLEERVAKSDEAYRSSGNVLIDRLLGATLHAYPHGEDEDGADGALRVLAKELQQKGRRPYIIPLAPGHPPLGALGYVVAAQELLTQFEDKALHVGEIVVASGSGNTHAGLIFGLRALGSAIRVTGICVRREAGLQAPRIRDRCDGVAALLGVASPVSEADIITDDRFLPPGYGLMNAAGAEALVRGAQCESLMLDPTYTAKAMAGFIARAREAPSQGACVFVHTGGTPGIFAYQRDIERALQ